MNTLPPVLINQIYLYRADLRLKDLCAQYCVDYFKLCDYLKKYKGVLAGSSALSCFIVDQKYNDIDIFILSNGFDYNEFFELMTIPSDQINVKKSSLCNINCREDAPFYHYKFKYPLKQNEKKNESTKIIDLTIIPKNLFNHCFEVFEKYSDIECTKIYFDGIKWNFPFDKDFLDFKICSIENLIDSYFSEIYDECPQYSDPMEINQMDLMLTGKNPIKCNLYRIRKKSLLIKPIINQKWDQIRMKMINNQPISFSFEFFGIDNDQLTKIRPNIAFVIYKALYRLIKYASYGIQYTNITSTLKLSKEKIINKILNENILIDDNSESNSYFLMYKPSFCSK